MIGRIGAVDRAVDRADARAVAGRPTAFGADPVRAVTQAQHSNGRYSPQAPSYRPAGPQCTDARSMHEYRSAHSPRKRAAADRHRTRRLARSRPEAGRTGRRRDCGADPAGRRRTSGADPARRRLAAGAGRTREGPAGG
ncbi:hypothetical protein Asera_45070 [Actinocatenispora sera]|uniref:Uncharacterized protein n=1 Tax=Actinocatenispora sera TaxID=390989 RepID=A0A810L5Q3_9ACTN|nr:hypothetical protein Asera_45070 [Actinocatenispora sera]